MMCPWFALGPGRSACERERCAWWIEDQHKCVVMVLAEVAMAYLVLLGELAGVTKGGDGQ